MIQITPLFRSLQRLPISLQIKAQSFKTMHDLTYLSKDTSDHTPLTQVQLHFPLPCFWDKARFTSCLESLNVLCLLGCFSQIPTLLSLFPPSGHVSSEDFLTARF